MIRRLTRSAAIALLVVAPRLSAQERGAAALGESVAGVGVASRVLVIGAHPDDEDTQLIAWLSLDRHVETAYLSLTRGDGGQNLIGNELGPALGIIRTEELLAARRIDGGHQYFTRAYDFGFSKTAAETFQHWPRDSILEDVVTIVRAFRPQVIVAVFSGTPRDGHGHHQVSAILAREAFDLAGDTVRFPRSATMGLGGWLPAKFYRRFFTGIEGATVRINVGAFSPLLGRSYSEIASESRSQHLSQGFGILQQRGARLDLLRLDATHTGQPLGQPERSLFSGIDTSWARFRGLPLAPPIRAALDSIPEAVAEVTRHLDLANPSGMVAPLARYLAIVSGVRAALDCPDAPIPMCGGATGDLASSLNTAKERATAALLQAAGVGIDANAAREQVAEGDSVPVTVTLYDQGKSPVTILGEDVSVPSYAPGSRSGSAPSAAAPPPLDVTIAPDSAFRQTLWLRGGAQATLPWWLAHPRAGDMFQFVDSRTSATTRGLPIPQFLLGEDRVHSSDARVRLRIDGVPVVADVHPIVYRYADPARGERQRPVAAVPAITLLLDREVEYARANTPLDRALRVRVQSAATDEREVRVSLVLPRGLAADSAAQSVTLKPGGKANVYFHIRGSLPPGRHSLSAIASSNGATYTAGFVPVEYEHIRPQRYYRAARLDIEAVDAKVPPALKVAYIRGVGDNVEPMLEQLGIPVTVLDPVALPQVDLSRFTTIVVGPRAFGASDALVANNGRLLTFARDGGTLVEQYGQYEMARPGILPYPITLSRPADRVTEEESPVHVLDPASPLLTTPNRIDDRDFGGWVQERASYMPRTFDERYRPVLSMNDSGEPPNAAAILVAALGRGTFVYTTVSFFRQLPAGIPGAARLFLNLIAADQGAVTGTKAASPATPRP